MDFMTSLQSELKGSLNVAATANGAIVYKTSGKALVDLNFNVANLRKVSDYEIVGQFAKAFAEDPFLAMKWLFFARDVRGGLGERRLFRVALRDRAQSFGEMTIQLLPLIQEYGRWDDVFALIGANPEVDKEIFGLIKFQLKEDLKNLDDGKSISLMAKWMPSTNTSSQESRILARTIAKGMSINEITYRKTLVTLRKHLALVETAMQTGNWDKIPYEAVPSRANLKYNKAFLRHDETRRREFLGKAVKGEVKMHASTLFPHEVLAHYAEDRRNGYDLSTEAMWKGLPDFVKGNDKTIVVADGSGSMMWHPIPKTQIYPWTVAHALAIYFAERATGQFKDKYITFSSRPELVDMTGAKSLWDRFLITRQHTDCSNTNIEKVFDLILYTAVNGKMKQEDLPNNVLVISDMEFDAVSGGLSKKLFSAIAERYMQYGYKLPKLIFWRVDGATKNVPMIENEMGVALMSGFSPSVIKCVFSDQVSPYEILMDVLNSERYDAVGEVIAPYFNKG